MEVSMSFQGAEAERPQGKPFSVPNPPLCTASQGTSARAFTFPTLIRTCRVSERSGPQRQMKRKSIFDVYTNCLHFGAFGSVSLDPGKGWRICIEAILWGRSSGDPAL